MPTNLVPIPSGATIGEPSTTPLIPAGATYEDGSPIGGSNSAPATAEPYPIAEEDKGAGAAITNVGSSILKLPGNIYHAFADEPKDATEKAAVTGMAKVYRIPQGLALGIHRLIVAPMVKESQTADAYETVSKAHPEQDSPYNGPQHMANMHRIASIVPLIGPLAADITEHYLQGDKSGAVASLLTNIGAGAGLQKASEAAGSLVSKIAPKTSEVAGETVTKMAGQEKNAAPIARKVASEPSAKISAEQQAAGQQGIKNVATEAANKTTAPLGKNVEEADSFGDAASKATAAAKPVYEKLDEISGGTFSTYQNTIKTANKMIGKAANMRDLEEAEINLKNANDGIEKLFKQSNGIAPKDLADARLAWRNSVTLDRIHSTVEGAFTAPEDIAAASPTITRNLKGSTLTGKLNNLIKDPADRVEVERVIGKQGLQNLYEIGNLTATPAGMSGWKAIAEKIAPYLATGAAGTVGGFLAGHVGAEIAGGAVLGSKILMRYLATSPRVSAAVVRALKFKTPAKVYVPVIASAIQKSQ